MCSLGKIKKGGNIMKYQIKPLVEATVEDKEKLAQFVPRYLYDPDVLECNRFKYWFFSLIFGCCIAMVKIFLRPRKGDVGNLDIYEVEAVYDKEAASYDWKHHMTTRGMDLIWRRQAGWFVVNQARKHQNKVRVLDLCTGTGLTIEEIIKVLREWKLGAQVVGLDYNQKMLEVATARHNGSHLNSVEVSFVRGNAMKMVDNQEDGFANLTANSFDLATQVFGIGGIDGSQDVFYEVLKVLRPGGRYLMIDMHQPIASQPCEIPFFWKWLSFPAIEHLAYYHHTMSVVLNRLWGWKDPTLDFYLLPLATWQDSDGAWWGFETTSFEMENQRWWFGLPVMPIARITVEKVRISEFEAKTQQEVAKIMMSQ